MTRQDAAADLLATSIGIAILGMSVALRSEAQRAVALLIAAGSICYGWLRLRRDLHSRFGVVTLGAGVPILALGCLWSGLNVVRFYLYNPAMQGRSPYSAWYEIVCTTQVVVQWFGAGFAVAFMVLLAIFPFRSHHARGREA